MPPRTEMISQMVQIKFPAIEMILWSNPKYVINMVWMFGCGIPFGSTMTNPDSLKWNWREAKSNFKPFRVWRSICPGGDLGIWSWWNCFNWLKIEAKCCMSTIQMRKYGFSTGFFRPYYSLLILLMNISTKLSLAWRRGFSGPWIKNPLKRNCRTQLTLEFPIRRYPDITHNLS